MYINKINILHSNFCFSPPCGLAQATGHFAPVGNNIYTKTNNKTTDCFRCSVRTQSLGNKTIGSNEVLKRKTVQRDPVFLSTINKHNGIFISSAPTVQSLKLERCIHTSATKRDNSYIDKDKVVSITYEEIGLFPRSFSRVLDRFLKQLFSDVDTLVIQEYRFYRYLFLTTIKTIFILLFVPFVVNFIAKNYVVKPITEYFWNTSHPEIFLNSYEQKRAFAELEKFEEKIYFEALVESLQKSHTAPPSMGQYARPDLPKQDTSILEREHNALSELKNLGNTNTQVLSLPDNLNTLVPFVINKRASQALNPLEPGICQDVPHKLTQSTESSSQEIERRTCGKGPEVPWLNARDTNVLGHVQVAVLTNSLTGSGLFTQPVKNSFMPETVLERRGPEFLQTQGSTLPRSNGLASSVDSSNANSTYSIADSQSDYIPCRVTPEQTRQKCLDRWWFQGNPTGKNKDIKKLYQEKALELALYYNNHSIEAWTNFFADLLSLCTLLYLLITLEIQINITKSFLLEVFFGLDDSKKSLLILLVTDLLVGYHSSNLWELFFEFIFNHYGIPESQTGIFLLVATLPVLLDVLFKYLIFRHLNRSSPATVATYQAIIE